MAEEQNKTTTLLNLVRTAVHEDRKRLHTSLPGIIESYDKKTQTASVRAALKRIVRDKGTANTTEVEIPLLVSVPVMFPRAGGFALTFPVAAGDECLLLFAERSLDTWIHLGKERAPNDIRFHDLSDAVAIMGSTSQPGSLSGHSGVNVRLAKDDGTAFVEVSPDGDVFMHNGFGDVKLNDDGQIELSNSNATTLLNVNGSMSMVNAAGGSIAISAAGVVTINGVVIDLSGNITTAGNIGTTAGDLSAPGVQPYSTHTHPAGTPPGDTGATN